MLHKFFGWVGICCNEISEKISKDNLHDKVKIVSQVHDEITCEVRDDFLNEWKLIQEDLMVSAGKEICQSVDMVVDGTTTQEWCK